MRAQGFGAMVGCVFWAMLPLIALGGWRFIRGQGWDYSRFGWSLADEDCRESMARDYLATRHVQGMTLAQLRADLGDESDFREHWTYVIGEYVPVNESGRTFPAYYRRPTLDLHFSRTGVLRSLAPGSLSDGPSTAFIAEIWRATPCSERAPMARALIESELLLGARRDEVRQVLGDPDRAEILVEYRVSDAVSDGTYLEAQVDLDGRILGAEVTSH